MSSDIQYISSNARLSRIVIHNNVVHVAGVAASDASADIEGQTHDVLSEIDTFLAQAGTSKARLLTAQIWLKDIGRDFGGMNRVWEAWVDPSAVPTRATCETKLARPELLVEIIVSAAL